jgi:uncharacterized protein YciI
MPETVTRKPFGPTMVAVLCHDAPDSQSARKAVAQAHLRWVESALQHIALAGPLYSDDGARMIGSLYVFKTTNVAEARGWLESDPYFAAGFWASIQYRPFLPAAGEFVGGTAW